MLSLPYGNVIGTVMPLPGGGPEGGGDGDGGGGEVVEVEVEEVGVVVQL